MALYIHIFIKQEQIDTATLNMLTNNEIVVFLYYLSSWIDLSLIKKKQTESIQQREIRSQYNVNYLIISSAEWYNVHNEWLNTNKKNMFTNEI